MEVNSMKFTKNEPITSERLSYMPSDVVQITRKLADLEQEMSLYQTKIDKCDESIRDLRMMKSGAENTLRITSKQERRDAAMDTLKFIERECPVLESMRKLYEVALFSQQQERNWWVYKAEELFNNEIQYKTEAMEDLENGKEIETFEPTVVGSNIMLAKERPTVTVQANEAEKRMYELYGDPQEGELKMMDLAEAECTITQIPTIEEIEEAIQSPEVFLTEQEIEGYYARKRRRMLTRQREDLHKLLDEEKAQIKEVLEHNPMEISTKDMEDFYTQERKKMLTKNREESHRLYAEEERDKEALRQRLANQKDQE